MVWLLHILIWAENIAFGIASLLNSKEIKKNNSLKSNYRFFIFAHSLFCFMLKSYSEIVNFVKILKFDGSWVDFGRRTKYLSKRTKIKENRTRPRNFDIFSCENLHHYLQILTFATLICTSIQFSDVTIIFWFPKVLNTISANIFLFKVNERNTRKRCEIFSKLTIKTPERRQRRRVKIFHTFF